MVIPIESAILPRSIRQKLLDVDCFIFPPDMELFDEICSREGVPLESKLFIEDNEREVRQEQCRSKIDRIESGIGHGIVSIVGPPFSGKTFFCHEALAGVLRGGKSDCAIYIDCDGSFSPSLLGARIGNRSLRDGVFLYYRVHDWIELLSTILLVQFEGKTDSSSLVVVDSIASLMRHEMSERFGRILRAVCKNLKRLGCQVLLVNQTTTRIMFTTDGISGGENLIPCLGRMYEKTLGEDVHTLTFPQHDLSNTVAGAKV